MRFIPLLKISVITDMNLNIKIGHPTSKNHLNSCTTWMHDGDCPTAFGLRQLKTIRRSVPAGNGDVIPEEVGGNEARGLMGELLQNWQGPCGRLTRECNRLGSASQPHALATANGRYLWRQLRRLYPDHTPLLNPFSSPSPSAPFSANRIAWITLPAANGESPLAALR